jgi:hypothetical protein
MQTKTKEDRALEVKKLLEISSELMAKLGEGVPVFKLSNASEPYSARNSLLIRLENAEAKLCGGYQEWLKAGRVVSKGQKGIRILVPLVLKKDKEDPNSGTFLRFRVGYVFDISQTEELV